MTELGRNVSCHAKCHEVARRKKEERTRVHTIWVQDGMTPPQQPYPRDIWRCEKAFWIPKAHINNFQIYPYVENVLRFWVLTNFYKNQLHKRKTLHPVPHSLTHGVFALREGILNSPELYVTIYFVPDTGNVRVFPVMTFFISPTHISHPLPPQTYPRDIWRWRQEFWIPQGHIYNFVIYLGIENVRRFWVMKNFKRTNHIRFWILNGLQLNIPIIMSMCTKLLKSIS